MNAEFDRRISSHNWHAVLAAFLSFLGACVGWVVGYGFFVGFVLGVATVISGQEVILGEKLMSLPGWLNVVAAGLAAGLMTWAMLDHWASRFRPVSDRAVIGWHIFWDILLLPARLSIGVLDQLGGMVRLDSSEREEAVAVLRHIAESHPCERHSLGAFFPDQARLRREILALQLLGWVDLLEGEKDWIYIVRSTEQEEVDEVLAAGGVG